MWRWRSEIVAIDCALEKIKNKPVYTQSINVYLTPKLNINLLQTVVTLSMVQTNCNNHKKARLDSWLIIISYI